MVKHLLIFILYFGLSGSVQALEECDFSKLEWTKTEPLKLLSNREAYEAGYFNSPGTTAYLHVMVIGEVTLHYRISKQGVVENIEVVNSEYSLLGPDRHVYPEGHFDGYLDIPFKRLLAGWRLAPLEERCQKTQTFRLGYGDGLKK